VSGDKIGETRGNADHGFFELTSRDARCKQKRPVRRPLQAFFDPVTSQFGTPKNLAAKKPPMGGRPHPDE